MKLKNARLYGVTGGSGKIPVEVRIEEAIKGGAGIIQLREKDISDDEYLKIACRVRAVTEKYGVPLIINDSVDIAVKSGAQGVHLGQSDGSPAAARKIMGENAIIGVTAKTVAQAAAAQEQSADYLGCGAVFPSYTKENALPISLETLTAICRAVTIPVFAIGGITAENAAVLKGTGISGIAVVSALFGGEDIYMSAKRLLRAAKDACI